MRASSLVLAFIMAALAPSAVAAQKNCRKGIPCGNTCIAADKVCRIGGTPPAPRTDPRPLGTASGTIFVGSKAVRVYFLAGCPAALDLAPRNTREFPSAEDAQRAGYRRSRVDGC